MTTDYFIKTVRSATTFLSRWQGAHASVYQMSSSHRVLTLVLWLPPAPFPRSNLCIQIPDPLWMQGPFRWEPSAVAISAEETAATAARGLSGRETVFVVRDESAEFVLISESLEIMENLILK